MKGPLANSAYEKPLYFPAGDETLFGILTYPTVEERRIGVILIYGGAYNMSANANRLWLRLARQFAGLGLHTLRYDYHGIGDSTGEAGVFDHRSPFTEDLQGAIRWMRDDGFRRLILVGDCLGARASLVCAPEVDEIEAMLLLVPMVRDATKGKDEEWASNYGAGHYVRRALQLKTWRTLSDPTLRASYRRVTLAKFRQMTDRRPRSEDRNPVDKASDPGDAWVSDTFLDLMKRTLDRGVRIDILFGSEDTERRGDFDHAATGRLGEILREAGSLVKVSTVEGSMSGITDIAAQDEIVRHAIDWLDSVAAPG